MAGLHHFPHQAINGAWHAVYRLPGCGTLHSIGDAPSRAAAKAMADEANREQSSRLVAALPARRIPAGFYTDKEAA